jgi:hypothetical protein
MLEHATRYGSIADDDGLAAPHDAGFLAADLLARLAEPLAVIEIDADDECAVRVERIGRVEPAAHAHFENRDVRRMAPKYLERRDERRFEVRQRDRAERRGDGFECLYELPIGRIDSVHADAFIEAPDVRRSESADVVPGVPIDALEHGDARALAVRAGNGHNLVRRLAQPELVKRRDESVETQIDPLRMHRLEPSEPAIQRQTALRLRGHGHRASGLRRVRAGSRA